MTSEFVDLKEQLEKAPLPNQSDDLVWGVLNDQFCAFKVRANGVEKTFLCRNEYNLTGLCNRTSCPLANTKYATVRDDGESILLFIKNPKFQHYPRKLWDRISLSGTDKPEAMKLMKEKLASHSSFVKDKCLTRYERLLQVRSQAEQLKEKADKVTILTVKGKQEKKLASRMERANKVARLEQSIESELLKRLHSGVYGDIYNLDKQTFNETLDAEEEKVEFVEDDEEDEMYELEEESEDDMEDLLLVRKRR